MVNKKLIMFFTSILLITLACSLSGGGETAAITVSISAPTDGSTFTVGQDIRIVASVIADAGIEKAYLSVNGQIVATEEPGTLPQAHVTNFSWIPVALGNVKLSVVASDGEGNSSDPVSINIEIVDGPGGSSTEGGEAGSDTLADATPTFTQEVPPTFTPVPPTNTPPPTPTFTYTPHPPTPTFTPTETTAPIQAITLPPIIVSLVPQVETVWAQEDVPAGSTASASVQCPVESVVVGGGFVTNLGVYVYTHSKHENGWQAYGSNFNASTKKVNAYAVCLKFVSNASTQQILKQVTVPANSVGGAEAKCPSGTTVVGGGFASKHDYTLRVYTATMKDNGYQVYAKNTTGSGQKLNAYAICLSSDKTTSSSLVWEGVDVPANSTKGAEATCPEGDYATGGGFAGSEGLVIYNISPYQWNVWRGYGNNTTGASKLLNVYAICLSFD